MIVGVTIKSVLYMNFFRSWWTR